MSEFPETRESLLLQIQDAANRDAWAEFAAIYRPLIYRMARRRGLQDADAQDLAQRVLMSVASAIDSWQPDRERARFRTWLSRVARNAIIDALRRFKPDEPHGGSTLIARLSQQPASGDSQELDREHRRQVFRWAARQVRDEFEESTWLAFWQTTVDGTPVEDVARVLQRSAGSIYTARSRVMRRLREKVRDYEE